MFVGRVCNTPEMKMVGDNVVTTFRLAVDGRNDKTTFVPCEAWGKIAEILTKYVDKGREIAIEARLKHRQFERDGNKRTIYEFVVEDFTLIGKGKSAKNQKHGGAADDTTRNTTDGVQNGAQENASAED
jgi:single-strand DNA-binding protein